VNDPDDVTPPDVLIVDDDDLGQFALAGLLRRWGIGVVTALSPAEAYAAPPCRVVVMELRLTGQTAAEGLELLTRLRQQRPESDFVIFSSFLCGSHDERIAGVVTALPKTTPFREAAEAIRALLEQPDERRSAGMAS
jgi:DNA-binding NarL/FixJ family response regulator